MTKPPPLEPDDFPVQAEQTKIVTDTGEVIAEARDDKTAEEVADRLNEDENRREEDRWSA